ncbi:MAG: phosphomannomutase/phosphoglucomutase [Porticoccaceae bacterium]|jgi:phosphomannomutase / phosphoglucomutase|nr:phosphomannomutase/phosphoglucomutase [Porticoccaceae bacterium]
MNSGYGSATEPVQELSPLDRFVAIESKDLPARVFRANDIRGIANTEITPQFARQLARAFALVLKESGQNSICICRDGRTTSPILSEALKSGLLESGCYVHDLGIGPTPLLGQFLANSPAHDAGIMITASHNSREYNGFKIILGGEAYSGDKLQQLMELMSRQSFEAGTADLRQVDAVPNYLKFLKADAKNIGGLRIAIDGANGVAGQLACRAFAELGCQVESLYCDIDGNFPNHSPDPCVSDNLKEICQKVIDTQSDFGIALDGDGDRVVAIDNLGQILTPDQLYQLFAKDLLQSNPGAKLVFDVKASKQIADNISRWGGTALMEKSGRTFIQSRVRSEQALLGGEYSSHYFFMDRWNAVDDGIYAAYRLAELIHKQGRPLSEILPDVPTLPSTEELEIKVPDEQKREIFQEFRQNADFPGAKLIEIDGLRIEYPQAWGLVRVSNTGPKLSIRFEGETETALRNIQSEFRQIFEQLDSELNLPF